ncbi:WD40 domain-containing protein [Purpureocillium lavendulum]|uniref:WD40 domain-containing protein n=1 Tax=Purpureocillium lavendulum TaxID=1247861 RepID=A0AB34G4F8_9HYPO|nr:WD40 domain-containing protein [Purpureocillium lavendulum]
MGDKRRAAANAVDREKMWHRDVPHTPYREQQHANICKEKGPMRAFQELDQCRIKGRQEFWQLIVIGPISAFLWSPSSSNILVATASHVQVSSAADSSFKASIRIPACPSGKPGLIYFGAGDYEVLLCSLFGLKLSIIDLTTSKIVEIGSPKLHHASSAPRGFSIRPGTGHLAVLSRVGGKDMVSIHGPGARHVERSWSPDTIDCQGMLWTPDGTWLLVWESPSQGHQLSIFTADGQHFRTLGAANLLLDHSLPTDGALEAGIKTCQLSPDAALCALGDHSAGVTILDTRTWRACLRLMHPTIIIPRDTTQVWQEQVSSAGQGHSTQSFVRATQMVAPPAQSSEAKHAAPLSPGCSMAAFDASSTLLATRLDDSPCAIWIWDVAAAELRAVLIFHSAVGFSWHPSVRELLLVTCQDEGRRGATFVWDPLSDGPLLVSEADGLPNAAQPAKAVGKRPKVLWVDRDTEFPEVLVADAERYALVSLCDAQEGHDPWRNEGGVDHDGPSPARDDAEDTGRPVVLSPGDISGLDDTFSFRNSSV